MDYKCTEEQFKICENNSKCYLCDGTRLYKEPKWMKVRNRQAERKAAGIKKQKKEGMGFEKKVAKQYNKSIAPRAPRKDSASRRAGSGAIWSMPGDIITPEELMECKERGSTTSRGEKTITIPKEHLDKIKYEAFLAKRNIWYYVFGYKNTEEIYVVKDFQDELAMIQQIKMLKERILELEEALDNEDR